MDKTVYVNSWTYATDNSNIEDSPVKSRPFFSIPQSQLPQNYDAVEILNTNARRALGVFARQDLPAGHRVIVDYPMISCIHWRQRKGRRTVGEEWSKLSPQARADFRNAFTRLQHLPLDKVPSASTRKKLEHFIEDYGFWDGRQTYAFIFKLGSHINHACLSCANAQHYVDAEEPNTMTVRLTRNVKKGDELFINYGKAKMAFGCAICGGNINGRHSQNQIKDGSGIKESLHKIFHPKPESTAGGLDHIYLPFRTLTRTSTRSTASSGNRSLKRAGGLLSRMFEGDPKKVDGTSPSHPSDTTGQQANSEGGKVHEQ